MSEDESRECHRDIRRGNDEKQLGGSLVRRCESRGHAVTGAV